MIMFHDESWIFALETVQGFQEGVKLVLLLWLYCQTHDWLRNMHRRHREVTVQVAERLTRCTVNAEKRENISRTCLVYILHLRWMHSDHPRNFSLLTCASIYYSVTLLNFSLIYSNPSQLPVLSFFEFECQANKRFFAIYDHLSFFSILCFVKGVVFNLLWIW